MSRAQRKSSLKVKDLKFGTSAQRNQLQGEDRDWQPLLPSRLGQVSLVVPNEYLKHHFFGCGTCTETFVPKSARALAIENEGTGAHF